MWKCMGYFPHDFYFVIMEDKYMANDMFEFSFTSPYGSREQYYRDIIYPLKHFYRMLPEEFKKLNLPEDVKEIVMGEPRTSIQFGEIKQYSLDDLAHDIETGCVVMDKNGLAIVNGQPKTDPVLPRQTTEPLEMRVIEELTESPLAKMLRTWVEGVFTDGGKIDVDRGIPYYSGNNETAYLYNLPFEPGQQMTVHDKDNETHTETVVFSKNATELTDTEMEQYFPGKTKDDFDETMVVCVSVDEQEVKHTRIFEKITIGYCK